MWSIAMHFFFEDAYDISLLLSKVQNYKQFRATNCLSLTMQFQARRWAMHLSVKLDGVLVLLWRLASPTTSYTTQNMSVFETRTPLVSQIFRKIGAALAKIFQMNRVQFLKPLQNELLRTLWKNIPAWPWPGCFCCLCLATFLWISRSEFLMRKFSFVLHSVISFILANFARIF